MHRLTALAAVIVVVGIAATTFVFRQFRSSATAQAALAQVGLASDEPAQVETPGPDPAEHPAAATQVSVVDRPAELAAPTTSPADLDREIEQTLAESPGFEALAWLKAPTEHRGVARWDKQEAIDLVRKFYAAGVPRVLVVDPDRVADTDVASVFVVILPTDPAARKRAFAVEAEFRATYEEDPTPDAGQKYLELTTD